MSAELKVALGDLVAVTNPGKVYGTYTEMAEAMKLDKWAKYGSPSTEVRAKVIAISLHLKDHNTVLLGIEQDGKQYVVGQRGVERYDVAAERSRLRGELAALEEERVKLTLQLQAVRRELEELN